MAIWPDAGARKGLVPFLILFVTLYASFGMVSPFLPVVVERRGLRATEIGLILALSTAVRLAAGPAAGRIADTLGALRAVFACCALAAAAAALGFLGRGSLAETLFVNALDRRPKLAAAIPTARARVVSLRKGGPREERASTGTLWRTSSLVYVQSVRASR